MTHVIINITKMIVEACSLWGCWNVHRIHDVYILLWKYEPLEGFLVLGFLC